MDACGVCRTDLDVMDGELSDPKLPIIPGHVILGRIDAIGPGVGELEIGERAGIPWLRSTAASAPIARAIGETFIVTNMSRPAESIVAFYNKRGTCDQSGMSHWARIGDFRADLVGE